MPVGERQANEHTGHSHGTAPISILETYLSRKHCNLATYAEECKEESTACSASDLEVAFWVSKTMAPQWQALRW